MTCASRYPLPQVPSAIVLYRRDDGLWLAISRGDDLDDWGFVGGKGMPGEAPSQTADREFEEETGGRAFGLVLVYENAVPSGRKCFAFAAREVSLDGLKVSREGTVAWRTTAELVAPSCTYAAYNQAAIAAYEAWARAIKEAGRGG